MNRLKRILLSTLCIVLTTFSIGQSLAWEKSYGWDYSDAIGEAVKFGDNYYLGGGSNYEYKYHHSFPSLYLSKINPNGDTLWTTDFDGSLISLFKIKPTYHNTLMCYLQYTDTITPDFPNMLMEVDTNGNVLWSNTYGHGTYNSKTDLVTLPDGGALFTGNKFVGVNNYPFVTKVDRQGNEVWSKDYFLFNYPAVSDMTLLPDGSYMLVGSEAGGIDPYNIFYININPNGDTIRTGIINTGVVYNGIASPRPLVSPMKNGNFVISGYDNNASLPMIFRVDSSFQNIQWYNTYSYGTFEAYEMMDGTILFGSASNAGASLLRLDSAGNTLSSFTPTSQYNQLTPVYSRTDIKGVAYDGTGGAVFVGTVDYASILYKDFYWCKIDGVGIPVSVTDNCNPPTIHRIYTEFQQTLSEILLTDSSSENLKYGDLIGRNWYFQDGTVAYGDSVYKTLPNDCPASFWAMLVISDGIGCKDTMTIDVCTGQIISNPIWPIPNGVPSPSERARVRCYPNPFTNWFTVTGNNLNSNSKIRLTDLVGKVHPLNYNYINNAIQFDGNSLASGIYILDIEGVGRSKIVKQ